MSRPQVHPMSPDLFETGYTVAHRTPATDMEALMRAAPHEPIPMSQEELQPLLDVVRDALDEALTERERWVIEAHWWRGHSYDRIAREIGVSKTTAHRIAQQACLKLAEHMADDRDELLKALGAQEPAYRIELPQEEA